MGAIFLSYARDDRGFAEKLAHMLEGAGHDVWWDRRLDGGEEFSAEIEAALEEAEVVLVAWSNASVKSRWVRDEAVAGIEKGKLIAITVDGSRPPMGFRQFHTLDLMGWKGDKRDARSGELLRSVEKRLRGKTKDDARPTAPRELPIGGGRRLWAAAAVLMLIVLATAVLLESRSSKGGPLTKPTIALLPFTTASNDSELRDIASQAREAVSHTLSQSGIPVRLISSATDDGRSTGDFLLSSEVSRSEDKVTATVHLDEARHGVTIATLKFEAAGDDVHNLPERIGAQLAGFFDGPTLMIMDRRHPIAPEIMAELLATTNDQLTTYQVMKRVAANAPNEPNALIGVAFMTGLVLAQLAPDERLRAVKEARLAAEKSLKLAPQNGDIYASWCILHSEALWAGCEDQLRRGDRIDPDTVYLKGFLALVLRRVGRFEDSVGPTKLSYAHDRYNLFKITDMLRTLEFTGDSGGARELYQQGIRWYPDLKVEFAGNRFVGLLDRADLDGVNRLEKEVGPDAFSPDYRSSGAMTLNWKSRSAVNQACPRAEYYLVQARCMLTLANLGDLNAAYAIADKLYPRRLGRTPQETEQIWLSQPSVGVPELITSPAAAAMRRDPRYLQLVKRTGLLAYWRTGRLPDFCRQRPEVICEQLTKRS